MREMIMVDIRYHTERAGLCASTAADDVLVDHLSAAVMLWSLLDS